MIAVDGRDGIENMRREREVARKKVEGTDKCLGVVALILLLLLLLHGASESQRSLILFSVNQYLKFSITL